MLEIHLNKKQAINDEMETLSLYTPWKIMFDKKKKKKKPMIRKLRNVKWQKCIVMWPTLHVQTVI